MQKKIGIGTFNFSSNYQWSINYDEYEYQSNEIQWFLTEIIPKFSQISGGLAQLNTKYERSTDNWIRRGEIIRFTGSETVDVEELDFKNRNLRPLTGPESWIRESIQKFMRIKNASKIPNAKQLRFEAILNPITFFFVECIFCCCFCSIFTKPDKHLQENDLI